eukprot:5609226-Karenia_brevis.AAC.1
MVAREAGAGILGHTLTRDSRRVKARHGVATESGAGILGHTVNKGVEARNGVGSGAGILGYM